MFAVLYLPQCRLQAVLRHDDSPAEKPAGVVETNSAKGLVLELNDAAARAGVLAGMSPAQALARCPGIALHPRLETQEQTVNAALLDLAFSATPWVEATSDGACTLDLRRSGLADYESWGSKMLRRLGELKLRAQIGVAENPDLAWLAAQSASPLLVVRDSTTFLSSLGMGALAPQPETASLLQDWGIRRLGEFKKLPRNKLVERLGREAGRLWDQSAGKSARVLKLVRPPECFEEIFEFEREIETAEPLLFAARRLLEQLSLRVQCVHRVAEKLLLFLPLSNGALYERAFSIPSPTADVETLFRILDTHFEKLKFDHAPTALKLRIDPVKPEKNQLRFFENPIRDLNRFSETVARLSAIVGNGNAGVPELSGTHKPDQFRLNAPNFVPAVFSAPAGNSVETKTGLPLRRYRPAIPAQVRLTEGGHPAHVAFGRAGGEVTGLQGPYYSSGEWWDKQAWTMEEWDVEIAGRGIYRIANEDGNWVVTGCYELR